MMTCKECIYAHGGIPCSTCPVPFVSFAKGEKVRILSPNYHRQPHHNKVGEVIGHTKGLSNLVDYVHQFHKFQGAYSNKDLERITEEEFKRERDLEREPMSDENSGRIEVIGTAMDPEVAALRSIVDRLGKLETEGCRRVLEFCVQRFLGETLRDDGR